MTELDRAEICRRIAEARVRAGLTQEELAEALEPPVHWRTVQTWERGENLREGGHRWTVPWKNLGQIATLTGVTKEWLLQGESAPQPLSTAEVEARLARIEQVLEALVARLERGEPQADTANT